MRTDKELLELLLETYQSEKTFSGICNANNVNVYRKVVSIDEFRRTKDLLKKNKPNGKELYSYWWPKYVKSPRVKFLQQLIKKYENR